MEFLQWPAKGLQIFTKLTDQFQLILVD